MSLLSFPSIFSLFIFGGLGSLLRYFLSFAAFRLTGGSIGIGTLLANLFGCFLFFFIVKNPFSLHLEEMNQVLRFGLLGGLTTFSSFAFEIFFLLQQGDIFYALGLLLLNLVLGIGMGLIFLY